MKWVDDIAERGVQERGFVLECERRTVPGVLWSPTEEPAKALVLLGHGGGVHKRALNIPGRARSFVRHEGIAAVAIDAIGHGDRVGGDGGGFAEAVAALQAKGAVDMESEEFRALQHLRPQVSLNPEASDAMVADWTATIDALLPEIGDVPVGYAGFSMGSYFGTSVVAREPRIQAATLGLSGIAMDGDGLAAGLAARLAEDSARISCPVLFLLQQDDEAVDFQAGLRQFAALGSTHKRLHVNPGKHMHVPPDETPFREMFIATHLLGESPRSMLSISRVLPVEA